MPRQQHDADGALRSWAVGKRKRGLEESFDDDEAADDEAEGEGEGGETKPKILPLEVEWLRVEPASGNKAARYILSAATYARLVQAVKE